MASWDPDWIKFATGLCGATAARSSTVLSVISKPSLTPTCVGTCWATGSIGNWAEDWDKMLAQYQDCEIEVW